MNAPMKPPLAHILGQETEHARRLLESMRALLAENQDDEDLQSDLVEGETGLVEAVDKVLLQLGSDLMAMQAIDMHIDGLKDRKARIEARTEKLKTMLEHCYKMTGMTKPLQCPLATISLRKMQDKLEILDEAGIPDAFWVTPPPPEKRIDKIALRKALVNEQTLLEDGQPLDLDEAVPGAVLLPQDKALALRWK